MKKTSQSGYALIDLLLASVIMLGVFTVFGTFYLKVIRTTGEINETTKRNEDAGFSADILRNDLERTAHNLTVQNNQAFAGNLLVRFAPHPDYTIDDRTITRNAETTSNPLQSTLLFRGNSELNFTGSKFNVTIREFENALRSWSIARRLDLVAETVEISENNVVVRTVQRPGADFDVPIKLIFSSSGSNADYLCLVTFWQATSILHQSKYPCTASYKTIALAMPVGSLRDTELSASEVILRDGNNSAVRLPLLPTYDNVRMTAPVVQTSGGFLILAGDVRKNVMNLTQDALIRPNDGNQPIYVNEAAAIDAGDVLFFADFLNRKSVLLAVETVIGSVLTVKPIQNGNHPGFGKLRSPDADFDAFTFRRGTRLVKMAAPVEYQTSGGTGLYRRIDGGPWDLVLPSAVNFTLTADNQPSNMSFGVSFDIANEGIEARQVSQNVRFSINPRALNRVYDVR